MHAVRCSENSNPSNRKNVHFSFYLESFLRVGEYHDENEQRYRLVRYICIGGNEIIIISRRMNDKIQLARA